MLLIDKNIYSDGAHLLHPFSSKNVTNIGYDLGTDCYFLDANTSKSDVDLAPGDTVFVRAIESISLPDDTAAVVQLKNSRIRQGLSLAAPIYQPGHETKVFFRITNDTKKSIHLDAGSALAYVVFIPLGANVEHPYSGTFQGEKDFVGMGSYQSKLIADISDIEKKVDSVKNIEKSVYGNVLSIMGIFVGIFSLINVSLSLVTSNAPVSTLLTFDFATIGAISFLIGVISVVLPDGRNSKYIWLASAVAFLLSVLVQFVL